MIEVAKKALLQHIAACENGSDVAALPSTMSPPADVAAFSQTYGLDPSFANLLMSLAAGDVSFWRRAVSAIPSVADTRAVAIRWIEWLWLDSEVGMRRLIGDPALRAGGDDICDLQRQAAAGAEVTRSQWRRARAAVAKADDEVTASAASVIAAAAWDLDAVPGAAADMIYAWNATLGVVIDRDLDWNAEKQAAADHRREKMIAFAQESATAAMVATRDEAKESGEPQDDAASPIFRAAFSQGLADYAVGNPSDLDRRNEHRQASYLELYRLGRDGLLTSITSSASIAPAMTVD
jgi:hypothetical protein